MSSSPAGVSSSRSLVRSVAQGAGIYSIALFAQRIASFITLPIVARSLSPAEYGISGVLEQISSVLSLLLGSAFAWSIGYFYFKAESDDDRRRVVGTTLTGSVGLGLLVMGVCWPLATPISRLVFKSGIASGYLRLVLVGMPVGFVLEALFGWVRVADRPGAYFWSSILRLGTTVAGVLVFLAALRLHVWGMLFSSLVAASVTCVALGVYCLHTIRPRCERALLLRMARFSLPVGFSALASFVVNFGDQLILPSYVSPEAVGTYVLAYKIGMLIYSFAYSPFHIYWSAQAYAIMKRDDSAVIFPRLFTYLVGSLLFAAVGLLALIAPLLRILPPDYRKAAPIIPIIVVAYALRSVGEFVRVLFLVESRPACDAITNWTGSAVCLALYLVLIPTRGIWGAAIATAISFALIAFISFFWTLRLRPFRLEGIRLAKVGAATVAGLGALIVTPAASTMAELIRAAMSLGLFVILLILFRFPTPGELDVTRSATRRLRTRLRLARG